MLQFDAEVLGNRPIAPSWKELVLRWEPKAGPPLPGQFLTLRAAPTWDPLLRRPLAFASYRLDGPRGPTVSVLYQVRGKATGLLGELARGSTVDVLGPLGHGFPLPLPGETPVLAAGGVGLGPVLFLAETLERRRIAGGENGVPAPFVVGFRTAAAMPDILFPEGLVLCTDDGSAGRRGTPVDWISDVMASSAGTHVYSCGPAPMLAALARLAKERGFRASLSAEQWMACGVGACMGCVLPKPEGRGFVRACTEGPVFELDEIDWEAETRRTAGARGGDA
jgi:dihydroorotate dehydrogenase electron transfer subunit